MSAKAPGPALPPPAPDDPARLTAGGLAAAFAAGRLTPVDALEACLSRIEAHDGRIGAFLALDPAGARTAAAASAERHARGAALGPLDGVPVAVKDNVDVAGMPATAGHARFRGRRPQRDAPLAARLREAGAVLLGKTNLDEGAFGARTANPHFGATENPALAGHTPGGSSGGSAAAVAASFVPLAIGTDTLGSVRIPAAYCGVWGLKPTEGLVPRTGVAPLSFTLDTAGPIARSASDLAAALRAIRGFDAADEASVDAPASWRALDDALQDLAGVVLAVPGPLRVDALQAPVRAAFEAGLDAARRLGARIETAPLEGWRPDMDRRAGLLVAEVEVAAALEDELMAGRAGFGETFLALVDYGRRAPVTKLARAMRALRRAGAAGRRAVADVDALVLPTTPQVAFPREAEAPDDQADLTALANFSGCPAVSLPVAADGWPAGLQLVGRPFGEGRLLCLAEAIGRLLAAEGR